ncbi:interferon regulatory factor 1-like isoform X2 [Dendronephthya gigantea]|uniref:interferon regulatory factor 1-like isoform X2 n=1 Tax=Dendronephthya gigantea TaxID=151771 RepID=UPI00106B6F51|nr:interferon regulatory factor 1-like isoform X2 [Dendronephthya gigantea]
MPIERLRMRPWLEDALNENKFPGVEWVDKDAKIFRLPWKHASRNGWKINTDACLFRAWAEHTGKYKSNEAPNPKTWKANFRCALNSLPDMEEMVHQRMTKGNDAFKVYKINNDVAKKNYSSKKLKGRNQRKKKAFSKERNLRRDPKIKKINSETDAEQSQSYDASCRANVTSEYLCNIPQMINDTHLVDHDYAVTRYFDIYNETSDEDMKEVFDVPDSTVVKTEPQSPKRLRDEDEFSLYEENGLDSRRSETSCIKEEDKIMSDDEVVELIHEMSSDSGSSCGSVDAAMDELLELVDSGTYNITQDNRRRRREQTALRQR